MRYLSSPHFSVARPLAFCAVLFSLWTGVGSLHAKDDVATRMLNAELPHGTILESATCPETVYATRQAVRKHPAEAIPIMQCAINSRVSPGDHLVQKGHIRLHDDKDVVMPCECLTRIVQAALQAAPPSKVHEIIEVAIAMQPQCAEEITGLLKKPGIDFKDGPAMASNNNHGDGRRGGNGDPGTGTGTGDPSNALGEGFGDRLIGGGVNGTGDGEYGGAFGTGTAISGFPGSPGFGGSPGGAGIFPPVVITPLTSAANP